MQLEPCARCKRHVAIDESTCPFCAASLSRPATSRPALVGRWSRAAIFAATAACHPHTPATQTTTSEPPVPGDAAATAEVAASLPIDAAVVQPVDAAPPDAPAKPGSIHGVLHDATGKRARNAEIELHGPSKLDRAQTNARGEFVFADLVPGVYTVVFQQPDRPQSNRNESRVVVKSGEVVEVSGTLYVVPVDRGPCCKPYGAPPARRRVV